MTNIDTQQILCAYRYILYLYMVQSTYHITYVDIIIINLTLFKHFLLYNKLKIKIEYKIEITKSYKLKVSKLTAKIYKNQQVLVLIKKNSRKKRNKKNDLPPIEDLKEYYKIITNETIKALKNAIYNEKVIEDLHRLLEKGCKKMNSSSSHKQYFISSNMGIILQLIKAYTKSWKQQTKMLKSLSYFSTKLVGYRFVKYLHVIVQCLVVKAGKNDILV